MNRRVLAAVAAVLLAAAGAWVILGYVRGADARAQASEALTDVLVVTAEVPSGTPVSDVAGSVTTEQVPSRLVDSSVLTDLSTVSGLVTTAELLPGELLQSGRFGDADARRADGSMPAPTGTEEVSVTLERQRAAGGTVAVGDLVGVLGTYESINGGGEVAFRLDGVTVTRIAAPADPDGVYTITLALPQEGAAAVVSAQSSATLWLSLQAAGTAYTTTFGDGAALVSTGSSASSSAPTTGSASTSGDGS